MDSIKRYRPYYKTNKMKYVVYVLLLEQKRLYIGMTKTWRLQTRWEEHVDPTFPTTKWTTKYPPIKKIHVFEQCEFLEAKRLEHEVCEAFMRKYGTDSVRGGRWNMYTEGPLYKWWVPSNLSSTPCFTDLYLSLSAGKFALFVENDQILSAMPWLFSAVKSWREKTSLRLALIGHRYSMRECSS